MSSSFLVLPTGVILTFLALSGINSIQDQEPEVFASIRPQIVTLFANDPFGQTFSFKEGLHGKVIQDHMVKNSGADIDFGGYNEGQFTVGIEGNTKGWIVDLGSAEELEKKYGYAETVGGGQGFASIRRRGDQWFILRDYHSQTLQALDEAGALYANGSSANKAEIEEGHIYLVRVQEDHMERFTKFLVVEYVEAKKVSMRWINVP